MSDEQPLVMTVDEVADYLRAIYNLVYTDSSVYNPSPDISVWLKTENGLEELEPGQSFIDGRMGDVNGDGLINILDALTVVNHILSIQELNQDAIDWADCNNDDLINILDVLGIVNVILGTGECEPRFL